MGNVTVFGPSHSGTRMAQVDLPRFRLQVTPHAEEDNEAAKEAADIFADNLRLIDLLREQLMVERAESSSLRSRLEGALYGKRRLFGRALLAPGKDGWAGEVWLMDPEKRGAGMSLRFASLDECRLAHPELWIVGQTADGVLLDAWGTP